MDIKFLGTGGYKDLHCGNSSALVTCGGKKILIDTGAGTFAKMMGKELVEEVDYFALTHLHGDHMANMFHFMAYLGIKGGLKLLYINEEHKKYLAGFFKYRWLGEVDTFVKRTHIDEVEGIDSIDTYGKHVEGMPSYGFYFTEGEYGLYYSGDLGDIDVSIRYLKGVSQKKDNIKVFHEVRLGSPVSVHCHYSELQEKLKDYEMYCYHCDHTDVPADCVLKFVADYPEFMLVK